MADTWNPRRRSAVPPRYRRFELATRLAAALVCAALLVVLLVLG